MKRYTEKKGGFMGLIFKKIVDFLKEVFLNIWAEIAIFFKSRQKRNYWKEKYKSRKSFEIKKSICDYFIDRKAVK